MIENNIDLPWKWDSILSNPNITSEFIAKYHDMFTYQIIQVLLWKWYMIIIT